MSTDNNQGWPAPLGAAASQPVVPQTNSQWGMPPSIAPQSGQGDDVLVEPSYDGSPSTLSTVPPVPPVAAPTAVETEAPTTPLPAAVEPDSYGEQTVSTPEPEPTVAYDAQPIRQGTAPVPEPPKAEAPAPAQTTDDERCLNAVQEVLQATKDNVSELAAVRTTLDSLSGQFAKRLQYDDTKETIIDRQHSELLKLREGLKDDLIQPVLYDVANVLDSVRKLRADLHEGDEKADHALDDIEYLLLDILEKNDVEEVVSDPGDSFNASRQRMVKFEETEDPAKRKTIVRSVAPGYMFGKTALFKEKVVVYKVVASAPKPTAESTDQ